MGLMDRDLLTLLLIIAAGLATLTSSRSFPELLGGLIAFFAVASICFVLYRYASR